MASKAETFRTKISANGFVLSDHEHEKSELINMTKNCEEWQVTRKIVKLAIFRKFCSIDNSLWTSVIINMTKNWEKSLLARKIVGLVIFRNTRKIAIFAAACKPGHK